MTDLAENKVVQTLTPQEIEAAQGSAANPFPVIHTVANGYYTRTGFIPAGLIEIGTVHQKENIFHVHCGRLALWDNVHGLRLITGPYTEKSPVGIRRIALALSNVEGCNILETTAASWEEAEREMFGPYSPPESLGQKLIDLANFAGVPLQLQNRNEKPA